MITSTPVLLHRGETSDIYAGPTPDTLVLVTSDRIKFLGSRLNLEVPGSGVILTHLAKYWFTQPTIVRVAPNHFISCEPYDLPTWAHQFAGRAMLVRRTKPLPVRFQAYGYLTGAAWASYRVDNKVNRLILPSGLDQMERFNTPMVTPLVKGESGQSDLPVSFRQMVELLDGRKKLAELAELTATVAYSAGFAHAWQKGIALVEAELQLGFIDDEVAVCGTAFTPDTSVYVDAKTMMIGHPPLALDGEPVLDWALRIGWNGQPPLPSVPPTVVAQTREAYGDIARRLTSVNPLAV